MEPIILKHKDKDGNLIETPYYMVKDLVKQFRKDHQDWSMLSRLQKMENGIVVFTTEIVNDKGVMVSNGWAMENIKAGWINKQSVVENCETSSIGRALRHLGYGDGPTQEEMSKMIDEDMKQHLMTSLETTTFDDKQKAHYEQRIKDCTLVGFDDLVGEIMDSQLDPIKEKGVGNQGDINKQLDLIEGDAKK